MAPEDLPIFEMPEPLGIYAGEMLERSLEYWRAFDKLTGGTSSSEFPYVSYFLLAHSVELFLKAYLLSQGLTKKDIKDQRIRHDAAALLERCQLLGLTVDDQVSHLASAMSEMNSDHDFRYPSGYRLHVPSPRLCVAAFASLRAAGEKQISQASLAAQLEHASATRHMQGTHMIRWSD